MIRVIGANPAMDRIATWPPLQLGAVNRAQTVTVVPGGKGFNVARAAVRLGCKPAAYGFLGGHVGAALREMIVADGVIDRHTTVEAATRVCFIVVEPGSGRTTVLNEPGPQVTTLEVGRFLEAVRGDLHVGDLLVLSGSLPDSVPVRVVGELIEAGHEAGARTVVDIHSEALRVAFEHRPWMLKCNRAELMALLPDGRAATSPTVTELATEMQAIRAHGLEVVAVTLGAEGALVADAGGVVHARVPAIEEVNPTGSGDLLLAGLVVAMEEGAFPRDAITLGAACGTAGATHLPPELPPAFDRTAWSGRISTEVVL